MSEQKNKIVWKDSMLCRVLFGPMTDKGYKDETGRPYSCIDTSYTVGEKTLGQLTSHPLKREPMDLNKWRINLGVEECIEEHIRSYEGTLDSVVVSQPTRQPVNTMKEIIAIYVDISGSMRDPINKISTGEQGTREITRLDEVKWLLCIWLKWLHTQDPTVQILLVAFNDNPHIICDNVIVLSDMKIVEMLCSKIMALQSGGGTQLLGAMQETLPSFNELYPESQFRLKVFTDGAFEPPPMFSMEVAYKTLMKCINIETLTFFAVGEGINLEQIKKLCAIQEIKQTGTSRMLGLFGSTFAATIAGTYYITNNTPRIELNIESSTILTQTTCFLATQIQYPVKTGETAASAIKAFIEFLGTKRGQSSESDELIVALKYEFEFGEIMKAFLPSNYDNWGLKYLKSIIDSYRGKYPLNASPVDSFFYTETDMKKLTEMQVILNKHGKVIPTGSIINITVRPSNDTTVIQTAAKVEIDSTTGSSTVKTHRRIQSCSFGENTVVLLPEGITIVKYLKPGQQVLTSGGNIVRIKTIINMIGDVDLYVLNESGTVMMTQYHPVNMPKTGWQFPRDISNTIVKTWHRYTIILERLDINNNEHNFEIQLDSGISTIALGHKRTESILDHSFFGNPEKIYACYSQLNGWEKGYIVVKSDDAIVTRDPITNCVIDIRFPRHINSCYQTYSQLSNLSNERIEQHREMCY